jgi:hypothetical protein
VLVLVTVLSLSADLLRFRDPVGERFVRPLGTGGADFMLAYLGSWALVSGVDPYSADLPEQFRDPWERDYVAGERRTAQIFLPTYYLFHAPLALACGPHIHRALRWWFLLSMGVLAGLIGVVWRVASEGSASDEGRLGAPALLLFLSVGLCLHYGTQLGFERGQGDLLASLLCWSAVALALRRRAGWAMALAVPAALMKGYGVLFALGLGLAFSGRRCLHAAAGAGAALAVFVLPVARYLPEGLAMAAARTNDFSTTWLNHGFRNLAYHVSPALAAPGRVVLIGASLIAAFACWRLLRLALATDDAEAAAIPLALFAVASLGTMLGYSSLSNAYNMILVLPGALLLATTQTAWVGRLGLSRRGEHVLGGAILFALVCLFLPRGVGASFSPAGLGLVVLILLAGVCAARMSRGGQGAELHRLIPLACEWAEAQATELTAQGRPLTAEERALATAVGVREAERVRVAEVAVIPSPEHPLLARACRQLGFLGIETVGLTLGHGIYLRRGLRAGASATLAHELRHVEQYERFASVSAYLEVYLPQLLEHGYDAAPFEVDARAAEAVGRGVTR